MVKSVIGLGAGGHAKVVMEILDCIGDYDIVGLLDPKKESWGAEILNVPVLGDDSLLSELYDQGFRYAFIGLGMIGDTLPRIELYRKACYQGFSVIESIHPQAVVSKSAKVGNGITIMAGAIINSSTRLGDNVIVNSGAIIEHDCDIGNHVHIATGARLAGNVYVGDGTHIGIGAVIRQCIRIGSNVLIGAGAVVVKDVPDGQMVIGNPAKPMERRFNEQNR